VVWDCANELFVARESAPANPNTATNFIRAVMIVSPVSTLALLLTCDQIRVDVEKSYAHGFHECVFDGEQLLWASNADWSLMRRLETRQQQ
jgi:hypothetical protein